MVARKKTDNITIDFSSVTATSCRQFRYTDVPGALRAAHYCSFNNFIIFIHVIVITIVISFGINLQLPAIFSSSFPRRVRINIIFLLKHRTVLPFCTRITIAVRNKIDKRTRNPISY